MNAFEAIRSRRSVKHYDADHRLTDGELDELIGLAMLAPTSFNIQNWRFVVVTDEDKRKRLRAAAWDQAQVTDASAVILLCADLRAHAHDPERYWKDAPQEARDMLVPLIGQFYDGTEALQRDEAMRSCGIAGGTIMIAAKAMGYDSCPMIGFDPDQVAEIIGLPDDHVIGFMITVGKPAKPAWPRGGQLPIDEVRFRDGF